MSTTQGIGKRIRGEPLVLFLILGAVLYGVWTWLAPQPVGTVRIEPETLRTLETRQEDLTGRALTEDERRDIREGHVDDEVLLREALRRGLQFSDFRSRQRLVRIMRGALTQTVPDPSVAQLQSYFQENIDRYTRNESVTLEQAAFPWGSEPDSAEMIALLAQLRAGGDPAELGSSGPGMGYRIPEATRSYLIGAYGTDFTATVEQLPLDTWSGPYESMRGVHLVRLVERHPPMVARFEDVESYLRQDWLVDKTRESQQARIDEIRDRYRIELVEP